jgi:hypothetical protein
MDVAYDHGKSVGLSIAEKSYAQESKNMIHDFVSQEVPASIIQQHVSKVPNLIQTVDDFAQRGDHHLIAEKFGYDGPNASGFGQNIKSTVDAYRNNNDQMAKISYMIDNGQFKTENLQKYVSEGAKILAEHKTQDSGHPNLDRYIQ